MFPEVLRPMCKSDSLLRVLVFVWNCPVIPCPHVYRHNGTECVKCSCDANGARSCDPNSGACLCRDHVNGTRCDVCSDGSYIASTHLDSCTPCACVANTTQANNTCDMNSGICNCLDKYSGRRCQSCSLGHYQSGKDCIPCACSSTRARGNHCYITTGQCRCKPGYGGRQCHGCAKGYFIPDTTLAKPPCVVFDPNSDCQGKLFCLFEFMLICVHSSPHRVLNLPVKRSCLRIQA